MQRHLIYLSMLITMVFGTTLQAAENNTLIKGDIRHSGFCELSFKYTQIEGHDANLTGMSCAWLMNERFYFGGSIHGTLNPISSLASQYSETGLIVGYYFKPEQMWHISSELFIGSGGLFTLSPFSYTVIEPSASLNLNITDFAKARIGIGYRFINGVDGITGKGPNEINGKTLYIGLLINPFEITYPKIKRQED